MSADDKFWMARGYLVRHRFGRGRRNHLATCERCGVKRRPTSSGWEWTDPQFLPAKKWTPFNPPCVKKAVG